MRIGQLVGSTSTNSINRKLVQAIQGLDRDRSGGEPTEWVDLPLASLPLYTYDTDDTYPPEPARLKDLIASCDGILIATPEYNRSIPGALKNALDWASRPYGQNALAGKPVGIVGASVGAVGTAVAQQHLRQILAYLDAPTLGQPEVYIQYTSERFADDGTIVDASTRAFLAGWLDAFHRWVRLLAPAAVTPTDRTSR